MDLLFQLPVVFSIFVLRVKKLIMRNYFLFLVPFFLLSLMSCDKISKVPQSSQVKPNTRKILLEDYTGHQCGNCPSAAKVASQLEEKYGDKLVVIAVHAGFFAKINSSFVTSFTCQAGNDWDATTGFGISLAGNPNGMVNRKNYADNGLIQKESKWGTTVSLASTDAEFCDLFLSVSYSPSTRKLNTSVKTKFKRTYPNNTKLSLVLLEDSIISKQKDYASNPDVIDDYVFMHVLRGSINGSWGDNLRSAPIKYNDSTTISYSNFALDTKFVDKNVSVVAFVYDATTKEVIQVEKVKIR
jgi:thiol-disulfide isomerase/thioredoxin